MSTFTIPELFDHPGHIHHPHQMWMEGIHRWGECICGLKFQAPQSNIDPVCWGCGAYLTKSEIADPSTHKHDWNGFRAPDHEAKTPSAQPRHWMKSLLGKWIKLEF